MKILANFIKRNVKLYFKDKGLFFVSLITPLILLILFVTFLGDIYENSYRAALSSVSPDLVVDDRIFSGLTGGQLVSSLLSVCCITVAFCSNMVMVQDKAAGQSYDFAVSPVKPSVLAIGYFFATLINTFTVIFVALLCCFVYLAAIGWFLSPSDVMLIIADSAVLVFFGTALSSAVNFFLSTQAQISAVSSIISSIYGFICGAYMPISQFPDWLSGALLFLPGTYATALMRRHCMNGALDALSDAGADKAVIENIRKASDLSVAFPGADSPAPDIAIYVVIAATAAALAVLYAALTTFARKKSR